MSRDVCGICWCPHEDGRCGCEPVKVIDPAADKALLKQARDAMAYWLEHGDTPGAHDLIQQAHDQIKGQLG